MKQFSYVTTVLIDHHEGIKTPVCDPPEPDTLREWLASQKPGTHIEVTYKVFRETRSLAQNRRYHCMLKPMAAEILSRTRDIPISNDQAHYLLKASFIGVIETKLGMVPKSSKALTVPEFQAFMERIEEWFATDYQVVIPMRGEDFER